MSYLEEPDEELRWRCERSVKKIIPLFKDYLKEKNARFRERKKLRKREGIPTIAICGWGRAGKDEAGRIFGENTRCMYSLSTSSAILPLIAASLNIDTKTAWEERHKNRKYWFFWCNEFRKKDPTAIVKMVLAEGDLVIGIRAKPEFIVSRNKGLLDHTIWIHRAGVPEDPTVEYAHSDCDHLIRNNSSIEDFEVSLRIWTAGFIPGLWQPKVQR